MSETWRPITGWESLYEVSDHGRVRSFDRMVPAKGGAQAVRRGRMLTTYLNNGYPHVRLRNGAVTRRANVHTLVLEEFVGPSPDGFEGCHGDGNPLNCHLSNLRWDTHSANMIDAIIHGTHTQAAKSQCRNGHEFTPENTYLNRGYRRCRMCTLASNRAGVARGRAA